MSMSHYLPQCDKFAGRRLPKIFLGWLLLVLLPLIASAAEPMRLAVTEVSNETNQAEFNNLLISQGIAHLVAQELYDTGRYVPVEDNAEISGQVRELSNRALLGEHAEPSSAATESQQDATASVRILNFEKSRLRGFFGPFSSGKVNISIEVEVSIQEQGKTPVKALGQGTGTTQARGVLFQIREDRVHFDQTSAGQAVREAVARAVRELMAQIEEAP